MTAEIGKIVGQSLGVVMKVDQNRTGDYLGDYLCIKVELNVFQPLYRILKVRLPNRIKVDVDLLYGKLYAYCFLYSNILVVSSMPPWPCMDIGFKPRLNVQAIVTSMGINLAWVRRIILWIPMKSSHRRMTHLQVLE
ncbi:hypothetical protein D8674_000322 [Pyrus ussuriensis x Pyrus communis]|uniref:Uncharacterized protein n=1 Tax=Pyrus ussuriensis x Pyrus communis TaxID=2448454 RepID=A0A5N5F891_9ROSA|nr:hypothetical protein D8674_000322 [Pyrus ussuriensis x Pyrus communis]